MSLMKNKAFLALALLLGPPVVADAAPLPMTDVFVGGNEGYPAYRIPGLITTERSSLLAFADGRASLRDHAENNIVMKRSTDGKT